MKGLMFKNRPQFTHKCTCGKYNHVGHLNFDSIVCSSESCQVEIPFTSFEDQNWLGWKYIKVHDVQISAARRFKPSDSDIKDFPDAMHKEFYDYDLICLCGESPNDLETLVIISQSEMLDALCYANYEVTQ